MTIKKYKVDERETKEIKTKQKAREGEREEALKSNKNEMRIFVIINMFIISLKIITICWFLLLNETFFLL